MAMQNLRFGFEFQLAQLILQARDRAREFRQVELDRIQQTLNQIAARLEAIS